MSVDRSENGAGRRVLILVENLPVPFDRRVWQESCALRDAGYQVSVICPKRRGYELGFEQIDGISIYRHFVWGEGKGMLGFAAEYSSALIGEMWCALKVWRETGIDIIHLCNPPDLLFLVALPFKVIKGAAVVYDVHDLSPEMFEAKFSKRGWLYRLLTWAERATVAVADVVLATNESVKRRLCERDAVSAEDVFVVRTAPHNLDVMVPVDDSLRRGKKYLVGYVGVMGDADGVDYLLESARHLVYELKRRDVQFLLMGSGPQYEGLLERRDQLGLNDFVDMPGRVSNEFLFTALTTMDLGIGVDPINEYNDHCTMNKTLEYMAFGKPQVMFGIQEGRVSAGEAAVYVEENSPEQMAKAVSALLDDPAKRQAMGEAGRQRLNQELSWGQSVRQLLAAYGRLPSIN